jgi:translation initiation factor IF-1
MKTKNFFISGFLMSLLMIFVLAGCSKDKTTSTTTTNTESMQQLTADENNVTNASDQALNDAEAVLSQGALKSTETDPCNTTITTSGVVNDTITKDIFYHGADCRNKHDRSGHVLIKRKFNQSWGAQGATVLVILQNFSTTKIPNGKTIILNGTKHFENFSGHYLYELGLDSNVTSVVHRVWGNITATFENNTSKVWSIDRQNTYTGSLINLVMTEDGLGSADNFNNLTIWGTDRNNEQFYSSITTSVVYRQACDFDPCSGIMVHQIPVASKIATTTFGYDSNNNLITNGDCPTRYKVDWTVGNKSGTFFLPL